MPHKHTRRGEIDKSTIDLPPTQIAKPLPVSKSAAANGIFTSTLDNGERSNKKRKRKNVNEDDTPKAFLRLMAFQEGKKLPKGLDDGLKATKSKKKRQLAKDDENQAPQAPVHTQIPSIRPGEKMSEFSARVDAALPVSGLINKSTRGKKDPLGLKMGRTKTERRMQKMYDEWRIEDARRKEKRLEIAELAEEEEMDENGQVQWKLDMPMLAPKRGKKNKKGKRKRLIGEVDDGEDDPWAKIKKDRNEIRPGLHDVVQAPLTITKLPKEKLKVRGAAVKVGNIPKASGSLRRREELNEIRKSIVEGYRAKNKIAK
ncbi:hypothetical protein K3495_g6096 [Podosphaera aphanis]|nr:hypothetical protein K3495_g6096 [Podosphaera aphanis]